MTDNKIITEELIEETNIVQAPKIADPNWALLDSFNVQDDTELFEEALIPPENFNMVCEHVYRSSFPKKKHYKFLEKLKLKSVLYEHIWLLCNIPH